MPPIGSFLSPGTPPMPVQVTVTVTDQNVGDHLHYQFVIDYPPWTTNTRNQGILDISPSANGAQLHVPKSLLPCDLHPVSTIAVHQLQFILADREFDSTNSTVFDALPQDSDGFVVRANWTFSCP